MNTETKDFLHRTLNIDMVDYLNTLGIKRLGEKAGKVDFESPFMDNILSVTRRNNMVTDYAFPNIYGNIIDFGTRYHHCEIPRFLDTIRDNYPFRNDETRHPDQLRSERRPDNTIVEIIKLHDSMEHPFITQRMKSMNIRQEDALGLVSRATFRQGESEMEGIAFRNNSGGYILYESFTPFFTGKEDITTINRGTKIVDVFNSINDFLALRNLRNGISSEQNNTVILNNEHLFEKARPFMEQHSQINLYLNHSANNREYLGYAKWLDKSRYKDFGTLYKQEHSLALYNALKVDQNRRSNRLGI